MYWASCLKKKADGLEGADVLRMIEKVGAAACSPNLTAWADFGPNKHSGLHCKVEFDSAFCCTTSQPVSRAAADKQDCIAFWHTRGSLGIHSCFCKQRGFIACKKRFNLLFCVFQEDNELYRGVIAAVMPDVFQKMDPEVTKRIRTFAKNYVPWLTAAMSPAGKSKKALPAPFVELRLRVAVAFAQVCR
jgi:hypothetical protein